ncbi:MAG: hypothetical protein QME60_01940 [Verrucomicrobiota bacterium]|nr:hypothetical protein [Verrucomicrobiota bacterium]
MRTFTARVCRISAGALLLGVAVAWTARGARAGVAQILYRQCKFGGVLQYPKAGRLGATFRRCEDAQRLYPWNYWFCVWTAESAWHERFDLLGREIPEHVKMAAYWCDNGLARNPYKSQLRLLKTRLLERESVVEALRYWEACVDWEFWNPYNHAVLVDLRARAGDYAGAMESLEWVKGSSHYEYAASRLNDAWNSELRAMRKRASPIPRPAGEF